MKISNRRWYNYMGSSIYLRKPEEFGLLNAYVHRTYNNRGQAVGRTWKWAFHPYGYSKTPMGEPLFKSKGTFTTPERAVELLIREIGNYHAKVNKKVNSLLGTLS